MGFDGADVVVGFSVEQNSHYSECSYTEPFGCVTPLTLIEQCNIGTQLYGQRDGFRFTWVQIALQCLNERKIVDLMAFDPFGGSHFLSSGMAFTVGI